MEHENDQKTFRSLYRIGMKDVEVKDTLKKKLLVVFFLPPVYTLILNLFFSHSIYISTGDGIIGIIYTIAVSGAFFLVNALLFQLYASDYSEEIVSEIYGSG
jgi:putative ABC transport system permease protein